VNPQTALLALNTCLTAGGIVLAVGVFKGSVGTKLKEHERRLGEHDAKIDKVTSDVSEIRGACGGLVHLQPAGSVR
jgi:hypothetical protein